MASSMVSALDTARFGVRIARFPAKSADDLAVLIAACRNDQVAMAVIRVDASDTATVQAVEQAGGLLCDTLVTFRRTLDDPVASPTANIRTGGPADADVAAAIAAAAFAGYRGHYHADSRLDRPAADAAYVDWARRSFTGSGGADRIWIAELDHVAAGFLTLRIENRERTEIVLNAVDPEHQRHGLYADLVRTALAASRDLGASTCSVSTQLSNLGVQRVWARLGFLPDSAVQTFHLWLD